MKQKIEVKEKVVKDSVVETPKEEVKPEQSDVLKEQRRKWVLGYSGPNPEI